MALKPQAVLPSRDEIAALREQNIALQARLDALERRYSEPAADTSKLKNPLEALSQIIESMRDGVALYDADDRFVFGNASYRTHLGIVGDRLKPGATFEDITRARIESGRVQSAMSDPEAWLQSRLEQHRGGGARVVRKRASDGRSILQNVYKVRGGGTVIVRTDITEQVNSEEILRQSEAQFRTAFDNSIVGISLVSRDHDDRHFNRAFCEILGYTQEEIGDVSIRELHHPDSPSIGRQIRADFASGEKKFSVDIQRFIHKNGSTVWCETSCAPVFDNNGTLSYVIGIRQDITERVNAEDALRESESIFCSVFENTEIGMMVRSPDRRVRLFNSAICRILGYTREEFDALRLRDLVHPDDDSDSIKIMQEAGIDRTEYNVRYRHKGGHYAHFYNHASLSCDADGNAKYAVSLLQDISAPMASEMALRASEELFRSAFENGGVGVILRSLDGKTRSVNQAFLDLIGYSDAELQSMTFNDFSHPDDIHSKTRIADVDLEKTPNQTLFRKLMHKDGRVVHTLINRSLVRDGEGKPSHTISFCQDLSEQVRSEQQMRDSEAKFRSIFENTEIGITVSSHDRSLRLFNPAICRILGYSPEAFHEIRMSELGHPDEDQSNMRRAVAAGLERTEYNKRYRHRDGHYVACHVNGMFVTDDHGTVQYGINLYRDLTEQNRIEQQLRQAQKMETVGQLTGGIAHDFNNFLHIIQGNIELARHNLKTDSTKTDVVLSRMDEALDAGKRGAVLIQQLLAFSRVQALSPETIEPRAFIIDTLKLLSRTLGEDIEIAMTTDEVIPLIKIDKSNLTNAILNLAINAKGAMPQGGKISIHTSRRVIEQELPFEEDAAILLPAGEYLEIALTDTGCGMSAETLRRAAEPFFTTKAVGEGSGLGLGMVYGFAEQSGGRLNLESTLGKGTTARIVLPTASEAVATVAAEVTPVEFPGNAAGCILLVEDDPGVRKIVTEMLEGSGYRVLIAGDGPEALEILDKNPDVTILFSDVVMPHGMSGFDLADAAVARHSHLKVLMTSGYPDAELRRSGEAASDYRLIAKPYSMSDILDVLSEILEK